jgi:hypothetical protein
MTVNEEPIWRLIGEDRATDAFERVSLAAKRASEAVKRRMQAEASQHAEDDEES